MLLRGHLNVASWLQADIQSPEIDFRLTPNTGHSEAHAGLPLVTQPGHYAAECMSNRCKLHFAFLTVSRNRK